MDRPEPGLIKWSPNPNRDSFLHVNLQRSLVQLYEPIGRAQRGHFEYKKIAKHQDLPPLTTYDWSPSIHGLFAVGTSTGTVNLLRIDDGSNAYMELPLKMSRMCHAVAFSTAGRLAVALDRVRSDNCLYIWDVNRLASVDSTIRGFPAGIEAPSDPIHRFEPGVSVSSVKFFEENPNVLVAGIKGQGLRIHDLRESPQSSPIHFQTKCCNNLAIDYADQNYFASSALDQPGVMIWDKRTLGRQDFRPEYQRALDHDGLPRGGALRLDHSFRTDPASMDSKDSFIRSIRFCRDRAGMLAVLTRTGQLRLVCTRREYQDLDPKDPGPELLEVRKAYEMDPFYDDPARRNDKIVSFDWMTLSSPVLQPRLLVLRASGNFDVLEKPSFASEYPFKLIPWQPAHRGLEEGTSYHEAMLFDREYTEQVHGPVLVQQAVSNLPIFGPYRANLDAVLDEVVNSAADDAIVVSEVVGAGPDPPGFAQATTIADKIKAIRQAVMEGQRNQGPKSRRTPMSQFDRHQELLEATRLAGRFSSQIQAVVDHAMIFRAKEGYLFNYAKNQVIVADDPWLRDVWAWVAGAHEAAAEGGMIAHPLDIGYMGVYTVWMNQLGSRPQKRLSEGSQPPDVPAWERCLNTINKRLRIPKYDAPAETKRRHHREMCLEMCNWGRDYELGSAEGRVQGQKRDSTWHTMKAAHALFRGDMRESVQVLKRASTDYPELLFVSLALQLVGDTDSNNAKKALDFDDQLASKTDPYLRAISSFIATGDWAIIADQRSLPLRDRCIIALRYFPDDVLNEWLSHEVSVVSESGDIDGIVLTGITDSFIDVLARYVERFGDFQTAALLSSVCAPRFIDDIRATAFRSTYRRYLQRHRQFFLRARFDVESTKRSKHQGRPTVKTPGRQIALRCVYCDAEAVINSMPDPPVADAQGNGSTTTGSSSTATAAAGAAPLPNFMTTTSKTEMHHQSPFTDKMVNAGVSCPNCKRHLPRCVVCLEVVGMPRSAWRPEMLARNPEIRMAARFPTFCMKCHHMMHLDHAREWFARHEACPVPECKCKCNFRRNTELNYR